MTQEAIQFELVSPESKLVSEPVKMAVMPGDAGDFGVGKNHTSLVASLRPGVVQLISESGEERKIFITGGFADVTADQCVVLAEEAQNVADLDEANLTEALSNLGEDLAAAGDDALAQARIKRAIFLTKQRLQAVTGRVVV